MQKKLKLFSLLAVSVFTIAGFVFLGGNPSFASDTETDVSVVVSEPQQETSTEVLPPAESPELSTDKADYAPSDTVTIFGKFFQGLQNIVLKIVGGVGSTYHEFVQFITTDEDGNFTAEQPLDGVYRPEYTATAYDENGNALASVDFTDAAVAGYDQCSNDDGDGYATGDTGCRWTNGNLQSNNSTYFEGDSTVQRLWLDGFVPGSSHTITFQYGTTKQGKHAYDFLTSWDHSESWITEADRCQDIAGCVGLSDSTFPIPPDPNDSGHFEFTVPSRDFTIRGGAITAASVPSLTGSYAADSETSITVSFNVANSGSMCVTKQNTTTCGIAIWFGAHISKTSDWEDYNGTVGATSIPGSPYHVALSELDGGSVGNRDNQMQAGAIQANSSIVIVKDAVPNDAQDFSFTTTGDGLSNFSLDDDADGTLSDTQTFTGLVAGNYSVVESVTAGWDLTSLVCVDATGGTVTNIGTRTASIDLAAGETVTCTFTNTLQTGNIVIVKDAVPNDPQNFTFNNDFGNSNPASFELDDDNDGALPNSRSFEVLAGTYAVSESAISGWTQTSATCDDGSPINAVVVSPGETVTCTFVNTKKANIVVKKVMVGGTDTFEFTGSPSGSISVSDGTIQMEVTPGQYVSTESAKAGWDLTSVVCGDGNSVGSVGARTATFNAEAGETVTCTFTNTKRGHIIVDKVTLPGSDPQSFSFDAQGGVYADFALTDQASPNDQGLVPGNYVVTENQPTGWDLSSIVCVDPTTNTTVDVNTSSASIDLAAGETVTCTFTNTKRGKIQGAKYNDVAGDGSITGDPKLSGWTIKLYDVSTNPWTLAGTTVTDVNGAYEFSNVVPGSYKVCEVLQSGWVNTFSSYSTIPNPGNSNELCQTANIDPGENATRNFGNYQIKALTVEKTANTTYTRTYNWEIEKSVTPETWSLFKGDSGTSEYTIKLTKDNGTDSGFKVEGVITITNPNPASTGLTASISSVTDVLDDATPGAVDCKGATSVPAGGSIECTYTANPTDKSATLNTATVTTTGQVPGGQGTVDVTFGQPTTVVNDEVNVDDTYTDGDKGPFNKSDSYTYTRKFTCDSDEGKQNNTAKVIGDEQTVLGEDSASVTVNCYDLAVTKDASTELDRTYQWDVQKSVDESNLILAPDQIHTVNYTVTATMTGSKDSNWAVSGDISVNNPAPVDAVINSVNDLISPDIAGTVECGVVFPYTLVAGGTLNCTYTADLPDATDRTNTATATLQNYDYDKAGASTASGTTGFNGSTNVSFASASIADIDECVNITDSLQGVLGQVCKDQSPQVFNYSRDIGPYTQEVCGVPQQVDNTATLTTADTGTVDTDDASVNIDVRCVCSLTQGYWKTHNDSFHGGAPSDPNWANIGSDKELTDFFLSGQTWYEVFWTAPKGNAYYNLAHQYMAARLNVGNGAWGPGIPEAIGEAETLFSTYTPAQIAALKGKKSTDLKKQFTELAGVLGAFNEGLTNPAGHCTEPPAPQQ